MPKQQQVSHFRAKESWLKIAWRLQLCARKVRQALNVHTFANEKLNEAPLVVRVVGRRNGSRNLVVCHVGSWNSVNFKNKVAGAQLAALVGGALFLFARRVGRRNINECELARQLLPSFGEGGGGGGDGGGDVKLMDLRWALFRAAAAAASQS